MRKNWSPEAVRMVTLWLLIGCVAVLSIDFASLTRSKPSGVEAAKAAEQRTAERRMWANTPQDGKDFLQKQYDTAVTEIRLRIEQEHLIFALKFALVGAILYAAVQRIFVRDQVVFEKTSTTALVAWAAVVVAAVVDWRIAGNQTILSALGSWVGRYERLRLGDPSVDLGWEAFLAAGNAHPAVRLSGQALTALLFGLSAAIFLLKGNAEPDSGSVTVSEIGASLSICLMTATATKFRDPWPTSWVYVVVGAIAIWLTFRLTRNRVAR